MWKRVTSATITPPYKSTVPVIKPPLTFPCHPIMSGEMSYPITTATASRKDMIPSISETDVNLHSKTLPAPRMMSDNLQWITKPTLSQDGSLTGAAEKFQIRVNTEGFQERDIEVFTRNSKLHVKAFRQEINKNTGAQITNRLERSYDVPYDADANGMSVRFPDKNTMLVEFPVSKPAFCNANRSNETDTGMRQHMTTNTSYYEHRYPPIQNDLCALPDNSIPKTTSHIASGKHSLPDEARRYLSETAIGVPNGGHTHKATLVRVKTKDHNQPTVYSTDKVYATSSKAIPDHSSTISRHARHVDTKGPAYAEPNVTSHSESPTQHTYADPEAGRRPKPSSSLPARNSSSLPAYPRIVVDDQTGKRKVSFSIEVHGFDPQDFHVSVNNNRLLIEANHVSGSEKPASNTDMSQKRYFRKEVTLPTETDVNRLRTLLIDGCVLEIEAPVIESQWVSVPIERKS